MLCESRIDYKLHTQYHVCGVGVSLKILVMKGDCIAKATVVEKTEGGHKNVYYFN